MSVAASPIPIYEGQDFYVPAFEVQLGGRPAGQDVVRDILSVTYKDSVQEIDSFEITINNWDAETRDLQVQRPQLFDPGERVELRMGYQGALRPMLTGEITSLRPAFPSGGGSTLAISGLNMLHRFRTQQEIAHLRRHDRQPDRRGDRPPGSRSTIETPRLQPTSRRFDYLIQDNQYDIVFLMERARRIGYDLVVEERSEAAVEQHRHRLQAVDDGAPRRPTSSPTASR